MSYCQEAERGLMAVVAPLTADLVWFDGRMGRRRLHPRGCQLSLPWGTSSSLLISELFSALLSSECEWGLKEGCH